MMLETPFFADRQEAGRLLGERLAAAGLGAVVVYALPRGGVPVALEVALALKAPLDLVLVRKIGAPGNPELALAAVVDGARPHLVLNPEIQAATGADEAYLRRAEARELAEIERRRRLYLAGRRRPSVKGRTAVIVDDGLATGATARAAVDALRAQGAARVILAVPVAPPDTAEAMRREVDELVCLAEPALFRGVGEFYADFRQLTDQDVLALLKDAPTEAP